MHVVFFTCFFQVVEGTLTVHVVEGTHDTFLQQSAEKVAKILSV